jgi:hypothetical protein
VHIHLVVHTTSGALQCWKAMYAALQSACDVLREVMLRPRAKGKRLAAMYPRRPVFDIYVVSGIVPPSLIPSVLARYGGSG